MDILKKIKNMRLERDWSIYRLSEISGVSQSTLTNMFIRETLPSISTLTALCGAFGVTLSDFFSENTINGNYTDEEKSLILNYRGLDRKEKDAVTALVKKLNGKNN